jgi:hypothetical protein
MTEILPIDDPQRGAQLEAILDELILKIMINLNERGYGTGEIIIALERVCRRESEAYEQDPDPTDDPA